MVMMQPSDFLDRLKRQTEDEQLRTITNILKWVDEAGMYRQLADTYKEQAAAYSEEILQLRVEAQVQAKLQATSVTPDLRTENERLRQELETCRAASVNAADPEKVKELEKKIESLTEQLSFQTSRADGLAVNCEQLSANLRAASEKLQQPSEQQGECEKLKAELETMKRKLEAHLGLNRELQEQIKGYQKDIKNADGADKRIRELEEQLHKREIELKKQVANAANWQKTAAEWESKCGHLQNIIDTEYAIAAQKRAIRDAKATGGSVHPEQTMEMTGIGGSITLPKPSKSGVAYKLESPSSAKGQPGELERIKQELAELKQKYEDVVREKGELSVMLNSGSGNAELKEENQRLKAQLEQLKKQTDALSELDSLRTANKTQKQQLDMLIKEKEALEANIKQLNDELNRLKRDSADAKVLAEEKTKLLEEGRKHEQQIAELQSENDTLRSALAEKNLELQQRSVQQPYEGERRRIEDVLSDYLDTFSEEAERQLAERFRETAFALMDSSASDVAKVMKSPLIGTEQNKRLLRNQARRADRVDIAQMI